MQLSTKRQDRLIRWLTAAGIYYICLIAFYIDIGQDMGAEYFIPVFLPVMLALVLVQYGTRVPLFSWATLPNLFTGLAWCSAFPLLYTYLVKPGVISFARLMELLHDAPCRRFGIAPATGFTVFDLNRTYLIDPAEFLSMGRATPFAGWSVQGRCLLTATGEGAVWCDEERLLRGERL